MLSAVSTITLIVAVLISTSLAAQDSTDTDDVLAEDGARLPPIGGPGTSEQTLKTDRAIREQELPEITFLKPWKQWKDKLFKSFGVALAFDYIPLVMGSNETLPGADSSASSGVFRFFGGWNATELGRLTWKFEHRHAWTDTAPADFGMANMGYVGVINPQHTDGGALLNSLYWRQDWRNKRFALVAGFYDPFEYTDVYFLTDPYKQFSTLGLLNGAGTIGAPSSGALGLFAGWWFTDQFYMQGGLSDANADPSDPFDGFDTFFNDREYFKSIELGWAASKDRFYLDNVHLTFWHSDEREDARVAEGWGVAFSWSYQFDALFPFIKAGYADDGSSLYQKSASAGLGWQPSPVGGDMGNLFAVGLNWAEPNEEVMGRFLKNQVALEVFWRWQISKEFAVTPNIQFINDPALNPEADNAWTYGLRVRMVL